MPSHGCTRASAHQLDLWGTSELHGCAASTGQQIHTEGRSILMLQVVHFHLMACEPTESSGMAKRLPQGFLLLHL